MKIFAIKVMKKEIFEYYQTDGSKLTKITKIAIA